MSPEAQLIALLEWMGWKFQKGTEPTYGSTNIPKGFINPKNGRLNVSYPKLTLDLMHEAETRLRERQFTYDLFVNWLAKICSPSFDRLGGEYTDEDIRWIVFAEKEQRLEALIRTIDKWKESTC